MVLVTTSCTMLWASVRSSSGTLSMRSNPLNFIIISTVLIQIMPEWPIGFPFFLQFKSEFCNKEFMIWAIVNSRSCVCWKYRASPSLAAKDIINLILFLTISWCPGIESSLVLLDEGIYYDQCVILANLCKSLSCFILYSKAKFACYFSYLLTSHFCIPVPYDENDIFSLLVVEGLVGLHKIIQLQHLQL